MTSLLSFLSSTYGAVDLYAQLYKDEEFIKLVNNCGNQSVNNITQQFVHKFTYLMLDPYVTPVLNDDTLNNIFTLANVTQEDKVKMYVGKAMLLIHEKFMKDNARVIIDPQLIVAQAVTNILEFVDPAKVSSGKDMYREIVTVITDTLCLYINPATRALTNHDLIDNNYSLFLGITKQVIKFLNLVIAHVSPFDNDDNDDDNDDDDDDDGSSDGNSADDESDNDESHDDESGDDENHGNNDEKDNEPPVPPIPPIKLRRPTGVKPPGPPVQQPVAPVQQLQPVAPVQQQQPVAPVQQQQPVAPVQGQQQQQEQQQPVTPAQQQPRKRTRNTRSTKGNSNKGNSNKRPRK